MKTNVYVLMLVLAYAVAAPSEDTLESTGVRLAMKIYDDCTKSSGFSTCLQKKAITFMDRLGRMDKLTLIDGITVVRGADATPSPPALSEEQLESNLPRAADAKEAALSRMLIDKVTGFVGSRTLEVTMPKLSAIDFSVAEGRGKKGGMKGMMGGMMMGIAAKMAALVPIAIAGLFLLAGKALITAKIALLLAGIIALKKLFAGKQSGGGGGGHSSGGGGWQSGGGGGGWQSSGGGSSGGWDKRSLDAAHDLAYKAYSPK